MNTACSSNSKVPSFEPPAVMQHNFSVQQDAVPQIMAEPSVGREVIAPIASMPACPPEGDPVDAGRAVLEALCKQQADRIAELESKLEITEPQWVREMHEMRARHESKMEDMIRAHAQMQ